MADTINSNKDAREYWVNEFGSPEFFSSYEELTDPEMKLEEYKKEYEKLQHEVNIREVGTINEFKINRNIELHFLVHEGEPYLIECANQVELVEKDLVEEYNGDFVNELSAEDDLFTRNFEE
jgi:hypothetical protein